MSAGSRFEAAVGHPEGTHSFALSCSEVSGSVYIHPAAEVEAGAELGQGTRVWGGAHVRSGAKIGEQCVIGERVYVDPDVVIGNRVKVQNQAALFGPSTLASGVFIGPGACLTNDLKPRAVNSEGVPRGADEWVRRGVAVQEGASVGAMATVLSGLVIGSWAMVGAGAVITEDVHPHQLVVGVPGRIVGFVCRCGEALADDLVCRCGLSYMHDDVGLKSID